MTTLLGVPAVQARGMGTGSPDSAQKGPSCPSGRPPRAYRGRPRTVAEDSQSSEGSP
jgi:hypothetical protein